MNYQVTKIIEFDAGHRVFGHEGKCNALHGHRYKAEITCESLAADPLDDVSRVIDFSVIKREVGGWIDKHWDHTFILNSLDPLAIACEFPETVISHGHGLRMKDVLQNTQPYILHEENPTAEVMARVLWRIAGNILSRFSITVRKVRLWETPSCHAEYPC